MKWTNLAKNKCPKCGRSLKETQGETRVVTLSGHPGEERHITKPGVLKCGTKNCGFSIGLERLAQITQNMASRSVDRRYLY